MAYDEQLAERVRDVVAEQPGIVEKKMFGGVGFMLHGNMCVGIWKESLVVRFAREKQDEILKLPHVLPFDITGRTMRGWALFEPPALTTEDELLAWIGQSVQFATTLPAKK